MAEQADTTSIEPIKAGAQQLALIVRSDVMPEATTFLTPAESKLQLGFVAYPEGGRIAPHTHKPIDRSITGTDEVLLVKKGRCRIDFFDSDKEFVTSRELTAGDIVLLTGGGHGFTMLEDCLLLEIKQGPYFGLDEKERF